VGVKRKDELKDWLPKDPIARVRSLLIKANISQKELDRIVDETRAEVEKSVYFARQSPCPDKEDLFEHLFCREKEAS
jgi:pyruvate dehydrogenase E1 component alpha subunit